MNQAMRDGELAKVNPRYLEIIDETCDLATAENSWFGSLHALDDNAWYIPTEVNGREIVSKRQYICSGCLRAMAQVYFADPDKGGCSDSCLFDSWAEAYAACRCDDCGMYRCGCPDER